MTTNDSAARTSARLAPADVDRLADEIAEVASHLDAATHTLLALIRRFDEGAGWADQGALTCAHWLSWRIVMSIGAAREHVRVARALGSLPVLDDALRRGAVSDSKVRAITRVATPDNEASLLEMAQSATASQLERICRGFRRAVANLDERPEDPDDEAWRRYVSVRETERGMVRIEAQLRPEEAAAVLKALEVARLRMRGALPRKRGEALPGGVSAETLPERDPRGRPIPEKLTRADALVAVAEAYLAAEAEGGGSTAGPAVEIVVHVDQAQLRGAGASGDASAADAAGRAGTCAPDPAECARTSAANGAEPDASDRAATLDDGTALPLATAQRLACDAHVVRVRQAATGALVALGRRTRRIGTTLRRALRLRDRGCRFPAARTISPTPTTSSRGLMAERPTFRTSASSAAATT